MRRRLRGVEHRGQWHGDLQDDLPLEAQHAARTAGSKPGPIRSESLASGQRWSVETEPDLGIGIITVFDRRRVTLSFRGGEVSRMFSLETAPLHRFRLKPGDRMTLRSGEEKRIEGVDEVDKLLYYRTRDERFAETEISDHTVLATPLHLLLAGAKADYKALILRRRSLDMRNAIIHSAARGFTGGRIDLIPHQIGIAGEVCARPVRRVLLADEVGLGKTIEATLILHRLIVSGQAGRALILVPESMLHVWFVELLRKFSLAATIIDELYFRQINLQETANPFLNAPFVLSTIEMLSGNRSISQLALEAGWDMCIIDEAHHLVHGSPEFALAREFAHRCRDMLLLTATPLQHGVKSHQARLDLLGKNHLLFRTTRSTVGGFPPRKVHREGLAASEKIRRWVRAEFTADSAPSLQEKYTLGEDPRVPYLAALLRAHPDEKFVVICRSKNKVAAIIDALKRHIAVDTAVFHEELSIIQRDRNAAWFSEDDGARLLLCSEIGSEGRNLQFVSHLVMFDLPVSPGLLEQRIGRLDRIGRRREINIHVPYITGTPYEILARWYDEGLEMLEKIMPAAEEVYDRLGERLQMFLADGEGGREGPFAHLLEDARALSLQLTREMDAGRNRYIKPHPYRAETAISVIETIRDEDSSGTVEQFMLDLFEFRNVFAEAMDNRCYRLWGSGIEEELFAGINESRPVVTFDRTCALRREDITFLSIDHPAVYGGIETLLNSSTGMHAYAFCESDDQPGLIFDAVFLATAANSTDEFANPPVPIHIAVDHTGKRVDSIPEEQLRETATLPILSNRRLRETTIPAMMDAASELAGRRAREIMSGGAAQPLAGEGTENALRKEEDRGAVSQEACEPRIRVDSLRLIVKNPGNSE
ncbi:MAG: hypothetical protein GF401_02815 [Chitinivibrionales bacterium]|nr:hypothetical protein [Chitinivibrionales bacterium]